MSRKRSTPRSCWQIFVTRSFACTRCCSTGNAVDTSESTAARSSSDLLNALLNDPQFAWLRPMSQLIVRIDEILDEKTPPMRNDLEAVVSQVRVLTSPNETGNIYERRYDMALQEHPDAVFAHRDLLALLKSG